MKTPFIIYIRAIGIYAAVTLPALAIPVIYFISLSYVLRYGWFAWALFTLIYLSIRSARSSSATKSIFLLCGVVASVIFAFQMLEVLSVERNIWRSGLFLLFPAGAVLAGWISVFIAERKGDLFLVIQDQKEKDKIASKTF
jgi:hypothetical protein